MQSTWTLRLVTALVWALAAASAVVWGLRLGEGGAGAPLPQAAGTADAAALGPLLERQAAIARLLGAASAAGQPEAAAPVVSRFALLGLVAEGHGGAALIVVDGKPAKPYRVGSQIENGLVLQSVGRRHAVLAARMDGPALQRLELPPSAPAQGVVPPRRAS